MKIQIRLWCRAHLVQLHTEFIDETRDEPQTIDLRISATSQIHLRHLLLPAAEPEQSLTTALQRETDADLLDAKPKKGP